MAAATIEIKVGMTGLSSLTVDVYPFGSDTVSFAAVALIENTNKKGTYQGSVAAPGAGNYDGVVKIAGTYLGDVSGHLENAAGVYRFTDPAAVDVLTLGSTNQSAGTDLGAAIPLRPTLAQILAGSVAGGASGTVAGQLALLTTGDFEVVSPVLPNGDVELRRGDSYSIADNRALPFTFTTSPVDLTGARSVSFIVFGPTGILINVPCTVVSPAPAGQSLLVPLTAAQTTIPLTARVNALPYVHVLYAVLADGEEATFLSGVTRVKQGGIV